MSEQERASLERRHAAEMRLGRALVGAHLMAVGILIVLASKYPFTRQPLLGAAAFFGVSGGGWLLYISVVMGHARKDLEAGRVASARVTLKAKLPSRRVLVLNPPLPAEKVQVAPDLFAAFNEGDELVVRYFPLCKALAGLRRE